MNFQCRACGEAISAQSISGLCRRCYDKQYREAHKEESREYHREYRLNNREHLRKLNKKYREKNKARLRVKKHKRYEKIKNTEEYKKKRRDWQRKNPHYGAKLTARLRREVLIKLGGKCASCEITDLRVLQIDHVNGGGTKERKHLGNDMLYRKILRMDDSEIIGNYQLLCANCNLIKAFENKEIAPIRTKLLAHTIDHVER